MGFLIGACISAWLVCLVLFYKMLELENALNNEKAFTAGRFDSVYDAKKDVERTINAVTLSARVLSEDVQEMKEEVQEMKEEREVLNRNERLFFEGMSNIMDYDISTARKAAAENGEEV